MLTLTTGQQYDFDSLDLAGWTDGDGSGHEGYCLEHYFDPDGRYLGPDQHGIEPLFANHEQWVTLPASVADVGHRLRASALETMDLGDGECVAYSMGYGTAEVIRVSAHAGGDRYHCLVRFLDIPAVGVQPSCS